MPEPIVRVQNLTKVFPGARGHAPATAVDAVSFSVQPNESVAVVGESGSGKTTVARMLLGLETPTSGVIEVCGRPRGNSRRLSTSERRRRAREMQLVFQDPYLSLDPTQRVDAIVGTALSLQQRLDRRERSRRVHELLEQVGLPTRLATAYPRQMSGGQRQRVAIARALAAEPSVLVLDEAVAALDVSIQAQVLNLLKDIRDRQEMAYVFITHDLAVVNQLCSRTVVMRHGRVVEQGDTQELLRNPTEDYTRRLRAAVPGPGWVPQRSTA